MERLRILAKSSLLDSENEDAYDRFTRLAAMLLDTPVSLVSLVDKDRQYFKSYYGLPEPWASLRQSPLSHSFCQYVVSSRKPLIVEDARTHALVEHNLAIPEMGVVAYLGFPLIVEEQALGSFCVIDNKPRAWTEREIKIVQELADFVATEIALRIQIVERQKVTAQLQESEERFHALAIQAPLTIWQADTRGQTIFISAMWYTFTGLTEEESLGKAWIQALHPDDSKETANAWYETFAAREIFRREFRVRRADGVYRTVIAEGVPYTGQQGQFLGYIGTMLDITEQRELDRQREEFISIAAHELKAPLTALQGNVQLVLRRLNNALRTFDSLSHEEQHHVLEQIIQILRKGMESFPLQTRLINDLQDISRVQGAKLEFHMSPCDLVALVRQTVEEYQVAYPQRTIILSDPMAISCLVSIDEQRTHQVLGNYLTNALKYSPPEQPIELGITAEGDVARVWVRDHGIGLSPEQQEHIWERFYQTHETPVYAGSPGLGLGLPISQALIHGQQGEVGVQSAKGEGSTFWFTLPLAPMGSATPHLEATRDPLQNPEDQHSHANRQ
jgi:PAS domain S-box-containing protein